jgi:TolA-binding protein
LSYLCYQTERYAEAATAYRALYDETSDATKRKNAASGYISSVLKYADDDTIIAMADDMEQMPEVTDVARRKARYAKSEALMKAGKESEAMKVYELLATEVKSAEGAEAYYRLLEAEFVGGNDEKAEQMIMRFAESKTPQNYWLAKSFLILGDIYLAKGDTFQARSTYQSVVDGYSPDNDGIVAEAKSKISKLN